jgi:8-oxo-dGTP pyrophosphatase MutT (NUDIX family)
MANKIKKAQVVLAVINERQQGFDFLLLQTNQERGSFWQNITGKIEEGETIEEGGLREAIEETGLSLESIVDMISLGLKFDFTDSRNRKVHEECFLLILDTKWPIKIDPHEHQNFQWIHFTEINRDVVKHDSNFQCLKKSLTILKHWGG